MKLTALLGAAALVLASPLAAGAASGADNDEPRFDALVFSKTAAFRHSSIPTGVAAIEKLGAENGFSVTATEDAGAFTDDNLAKYDVVIWLSTTGDVLDEDQQGAFERYIEAGGGYAGVHAASDTEYEWPWYGDLVGARFNGHPAQQDATVVVNRKSNPSTSMLPKRWDRFDEWYNFREYAGPLHVLLRMDEKTYDAGPTKMGKFHPISWCHPFDGGRAWYTGLGHTEASYAEPLFLGHLLGGIEQAAGVARFACGKA